MVTDGEVIVSEGLSLSVDPTASSTGRVSSAAGEISISVGSSVRCCSRAMRAIRVAISSFAAVWADVTAAILWIIAGSSAG